MNLCYQTGEEIHVGDRVAYNNQLGRIVFVAGSGEFSEGYEPANYQSGFMIAFENGARLFLEAADKLLRLVTSVSDA